MISDFARNTEWQGGMKACSWTTDPPIAVGSRYDQEAGFLGRTVFTTFEGTFPTTVTRTVEPLADDRSRVSAHVRGTPNGLMGLLSPVMRPMVRRSVSGDSARLKQLLEG